MGPQSNMMMNQGQQGQPRMPQPQPQVSSMDTSSSAPSVQTSSAAPVTTSQQHQQPMVTDAPMTDPGGSAGGQVDSSQAQVATPNTQVTATGKVTPTPGQKEVNISTVCRIGQVIIFASV